MSKLDEVIRSLDIIAADTHNATLCEVIRAIVDINDVDTYTEAQIRQAYDAGIEFQNDMSYNPNVYNRYNSEYYSFYDQFLEGLNASKL